MSETLTRKQKLLNATADDFQFRKNPVYRGWAVVNKNTLRVYSIHFDKEHAISYARNFGGAKAIPLLAFETTMPDKVAGGKLIYQDGKED